MCKGKLFHVKQFGRALERQRVETLVVSKKVIFRMKKMFKL